MNRTQSYSTLAVVSGKGGMGKTTLGLAIASELAVAGNHILIVDLDFPNRGSNEFLSTPLPVTVQDIRSFRLSLPSGPLDNHSLALSELPRVVRTVTLFTGGPLANANL